MASTTRQTALITGASSGIGLALAKRFAIGGYSLILVARSEDKLKALQDELIKEHGIEAFVFSYDLIQPDATQKLFDAVQQQGLQVDVLVNNAGYGDYGEFVGSDWNKQQGMISLNVMATTHLTHLFLPGMVQRGSGRILNLSSTAAFQPGPLMSVYFATKAYILSFSEAIAAETAGTGVTVTVLCPGPTQSNFAETADMNKVAAIQNLSTDNFPTAAEVADYGYQAMQKGQVVAVHGTLNKLLTFSNRLAPRAVIRQGVKMFLSAE